MSLRHRPRSVSERFPTPEAYEVHKAKSREFARQAHAEGKCTSCRQPHANRNPKTGHLTMRCEPCAERSRESSRKAMRAKRLREAREKFQQKWRMAS